MKPKITDEIKEILAQGTNWAKLEIEYIKLTAAEKMVILTGTLIIGGVAMLFVMPVIIMLLLALKDVFRLIMPSALAYLAVCGVVFILLALMYLFRKPLVINPISRFLTRLFLDGHNRSGQKNNRE